MFAAALTSQTIRLYARRTGGRARRVTIGPSTAVGRAGARRRAMELKKQAESSAVPASGIEEEQEASTFKELSQPIRL